MTRISKPAWSVCCGLLVACGFMLFSPRAEAGSRHVAFDFCGTPCGVAGESYVLHALELMDRSYVRRDVNCVLLNHAASDLRTASAILEPRAAGALLAAAEKQIRNYQRTGRPVFLEQAGKLSLQALDLAARHYQPPMHHQHVHRSGSHHLGHGYLFPNQQHYQMKQTIKQNQRPIGWRNHHSW